MIASSRAERTGATTAAIAAAAFALFEREGYDDVTVEDVAAEAGVSARTVFRHFPTKNAIVFAPQQEHLEVLLADIRELGEPPTSLAALRGPVTRFAAHIETDPLTHRRARIVNASPTLQRESAQLAASWVASIAETIAEVGGTADVRTELLARTTVAVLLTASRRWAGGDDASLVALVEEALDVAADLG